MYEEVGRITPTVLPQGRRPNFPPGRAGTGGFFFYQNLDEPDKYVLD